MSGDVHVRFRVRLRGRFPGPTRLSDTPRGAHASAGLYSLVESARANDLEPYHYLLHLFENLPRAQSEEDLERLLPTNLLPSDLVTQAASDLATR